MDGSQWSSSPYDRPDATGTPSVLPPAPSVGGYAPSSQVRGWKKFFAVAGVVFAFPFLLTLPGWWALSVYRGWRDGRRSQPNVLIGWGVVASVSFVLFVAATATGSLSAARPPTDAHGYTEGMRQEFVAGCEKGGGSQSDCTCYLDALERTYTPDEFQAEVKHYQATDTFSDATLSALKTCI